MKKKCNKCNEEKDTSLFSKNRNRPDGMHIWCKSCKSLDSQNAVAECRFGKCLVQGCSDNACSKKHQMCHMHDNRRRGRTCVSLQDSRVKASPGHARHKGPNGYVYVSANGHENGIKNGFVLEHRLVMSHVIGRPLMKHENVHHMNGERTDNRPGNLELWSHSQPCGQRIEDKIRWAVSFLEEYGFTVTGVTGIAGVASTKVLIET